MDFFTVVDQVIALLRSRGRVSYRALKRQFLTSLRLSGRPSGCRPAGGWCARSCTTQVPW